MIYAYRAYGLNIRSQLALPELVAAGGESSADVRIGFGAAGRAPGETGEGVVHASPDRVILAYPGVADFCIEGGRQIVIEAQSAADPHLLRTYLLGPALGILLHQRQLLVIHASAVEWEGELVAFLGEKGAGKSTLAAACVAAGRAALADDLVAIDATGAFPTAHWGFPQLKLFPESAALVSADHHALPKLHPQSPKRAYRHAFWSHPAKPYRLRCAFVLADADEESIEPMKGPLAFAQWVEHTYVRGLLGPTRSAATHFRQVMAVTRRTPLCRLSRRRSLASLSNVVSMLEGSLERAA